MSSPADELFMSCSTNSIAAVERRVEEIIIPATFRAIAREVELLQAGRSSSAATVRSEGLQGNLGSLNHGEALLSPSSSWPIEAGLCLDS